MQQTERCQSWVLCLRARTLWKRVFHMHLNPPSFTWERMGERWLQWDVWKNGYILTIWQWQMQVEIRNNRILFIVPGNKTWCNQLEDSVTVYSQAGQFLSTCHKLGPTRKRVTQARKCLHQIVPEHVGGIFSCSMISVSGTKSLWLCLWAGGPVSYEKAGVGGVRHTE